MRSEFVNRDYESLVTQVSEKLFPGAEDRAEAAKILSQFQGSEPYRVRLGILKSSKGNMSAMKRLTQLAISDWRDLLCVAEYPLTSRRWGLKQRDPAKYDALLQKEQDEYDNWLRTVLAA